MSNTSLRRYARHTITRNEILQIDNTPENPKGRKSGRYGDRQCVDACLLLDKSPGKIAGRGRSGNKWRRIYTDGRMYIVISGRRLYLDAECCQYVLDVLIESDSWHRG